MNVPDAGKSVADDMQRQLAVLNEKLGPLPPKRVLFIVWTEPLISVGKNTFIADALRKAGATSIVDSGQDWPQVSLEEVVHLQPDYLVFASSHSGAAENDFEALANRAGGPRAGPAAARPAAFRSPLPTAGGLARRAAAPARRARSPRR